MTGDYNGPERRAESMSVQRDLGRIDNELVNLGRRLEDHIVDTIEARKAAETRTEAYRTANDAKLDVILGTVQDVVTAAAERRGGWKASARILSALFGSGAIGGGAVWAILQGVLGGGGP